MTPIFRAICNRMNSLEFNNQVFVDNFVQEWQDMNAIAEGIFSLSMEQVFMLFDAGNTPVSVLAQECRKALVEEQNGSSYTPYTSEYH